MDFLRRCCAVQIEAGYRRSFSFPLPLNIAGTSAGTGASHMPRAQITITADGVDEAGVLPTATASDPTNDHYMENDGRTMLIAVNVMASPVARAMQLETTAKGVTVIKTINTAAVRDTPLLLSRIDPTFWNQKSGGDRGRVYVNIDGTAADVKFFAVRKAPNVQ